MTRFRILGAAALALVMLASNALAQETSSDVRAQVREAATIGCAGSASRGGS